MHELYNYSAMYQNYSKIAQAETAYQVTRLSHHASIVIWDGCNECGGHGLGEPDDKHWENHVVPIQVVATVDRSRPVMPSCPSAGWSSGVNRLTGLPNGRPLIVAGGSANRTAYPYPQESHGPYVIAHKRIHPELEIEQSFCKTEPRLQILLVRFMSLVQ